MKLLIIGCAFVMVFSFAGCSAHSPALAPTATNPSATTQPARGGASQQDQYFASVIELAHRYNEDILVPTGIPLGNAYASEDPAGNLLRYGYDILGELGGVNVLFKTPGTSGDFGLPNDNYLEIRRANVSVHGAPALLTQLQYVHQPRHDRWQLIWQVDGQVIEVHGATASYAVGDGTPFHDVTPGPDVVLAVAGAIVRIPVSKVDAAGILPKGRPGVGVEFEGQVSTVADVASAQRIFGGTVFVPEAFAFVNVFHSGWIKSYTVDLDAQGTRRLFLSPESAADAETSSASAERVPFKSAEAVYDLRSSESGKTSLLFFSVEGQDLMLRDASATSAQELVEIASGVASATSSSCCSLQLDMDPSSPGVQASRSVSGPQEISIDIVLGDNVGNLGAFNFSLLYDDTRLTPGPAGSGGLNGNPDFNESALGGTWNCALGGTSPDGDPATGPGHGMALLG